LYFPLKQPKQFNQDEIIEILDQANAEDPFCHKCMFISNIEFYEISYEQSVSYFKQLIRHTKCPNPASLPVGDKKSCTSIMGKPCKNHKGSNMWCHYCDKNNHNTADCRAIAKFKQQKSNKAHFEAKAGPGKNPSFSF
jgi:hypothetical protein